MSGGLDSMLAIAMMQEQGITVEALNFKTVFTCCQDLSSQASHALGVRLTVLPQEDDYLDLVANPRFGYGKGANPCVDCRIYMFEKAKRFMEQIGADFLISGEVVGQRPMSQKRSDLDIISHHSDVEDILLRPLSAKMLPKTLPEREGWVDRSRLGSFVGRNRKPLIALAKKYGIEDIPSPSTGCSLTEPLFSEKVFDLLQIETPAKRWDFDLLKNGRHYRIDDSTKVIVGRNASENTALTYAFRLPEASDALLLSPEGFPGPHALVIGEWNDEKLKLARSLVLRHGKPDDDLTATVIAETTEGEVTTLTGPVDESAVTLRPLGMNTQQRRKKIIRPSNR